MNTVKNLFSSVHGWSLVVIFVGGGISALLAHGVSFGADSATVLSLIGIADKLLGIS